MQERLQNLAGMPPPLITPAPLEPLKTANTKNEETWTKLLIRQYPSPPLITAEVPQGSILGPLLSFVSFFCRRCDSNNEIYTIYNTYIIKAEPAKRSMWFKVIYYV